MPTYQEGADEASESYAEETLVALLALMTASALGEVLDEVATAWEAAFSEGMLLQTLEEALADTALPIGDAEDLAGLADSLRDEMRAEAELMLRNFQASFRREASDLVSRAAREGWPKQRYLDEMEALAQRAGARFQGSWAQTWLKDGVRRAVQKKRREAYQADPTRRLFPYMVVVTMRDGRVRPNHAHMDGFTAGTTWIGWSLAAPLYGYGCRCVTMPISWEIARASGMEGPFPYGLGQYESWSGPDPGYLN